MVLLKGVTSDVEFKGGAMNRRYCTNVFDKGSQWNPPYAEDIAG